MDSVNKLRGDDASLGDLERRLSAITGCGFIGDALNVIADEIEREIAERYMPFPLDAWDKPIKPNDLMTCTAFESNEFDGNEHVLAVGYNLWVDMGGYAHVPSQTLHVKQRTLEDVLRDYACDFADSSGPGYDEEVTKRYANEIRELMEAGE